MMITSDTALRSPTPLSRSGVVVRALVAWLAMGVGLGAAGAIGDASGLTGWPELALTAAICGGFVVTAIVLLRCGLDRERLTGLGLNPLPGGLARFALGLAVTLGAAAAVFGVGAGAAMIDFGAVDAPKLLRFLALNALVALALEAIPEELTFRGYILTTLNRRLRTWSASIIQIGLFATIMAVVSPAQSLTAMALGGGEFAFSLAPGGTNPIDYLVLMVCFGFALTCARWATGSIWTTMGLHLAFLTANRLLVDSAQRDTGWEVTPTPDAALLVPVYLLAVAVTFLVIGRGRIGWRTVRPQ